MNLLGQREPVLYGNESFSDYFDELKTTFGNADLAYVQVQDESEMVDHIHNAQKSGVEGVVLNPAAFTHTSIAVGDAVAAIDLPVVEVHISNVDARESFRKASFVSKYAAGKISGFGLDGYRLAIDHLLRF